MKPCLALVALTVCGFSARAAHADQCAWVSPEVAARASEILKDEAAIVDYCEPCGDAAPGAPRQVGEVAVRAVGDGYREVVVDGRGIDLAYTYLGTEPGRFENLAALTDCPATDVSRAVDVEAPAAPPRFAEPPPAAAPTYIVMSPEPASPPPAPVHMVQLSPVPIAPGWIVALIASTSALSAAIAVLLVAVVRRRRRSSLPRALSLVDSRGPTATRER